MRTIKILLVIFPLLLSLSTFALAQDEFITIDSEELGAHQRPLVVFPHEVHSDLIDCLMCHHDYDKNYNNTGGSEGPCSQCHSAQPTAENRKPLREAFHDNCKTCHRNMKEKGDKTGPVLCGDCHKRK